MRRPWMVFLLCILLSVTGMVSAQRSSNFIYNQEFDGMERWYEQNQDGITMRIWRNVYSITIQATSGSDAAWVWNSVNALRTSVGNGPLEIEYVIRRVWAASDSYCVHLHYDVLNRGDRVRAFSICNNAKWHLWDSAQGSDTASGELPAPIDFSVPHTVALQFRNQRITVLVDGQEVAEAASETPTGDLGFGIARGTSKPFVQLEVEAINAHFLAEAVLPQPAGEIGDDRDYSFLPLDQYAALGVIPYVADTGDFAFLYPPHWFIAQHENGAIVLSDTLRSLREALIAPDYPTAIRDSVMYIWHLSAEEAAALGGADAGQIARAFVQQRLPADLHGGDEPAQPPLQQRDWFGYYVQRSRPLDVWVRGLTLEDGSVGIAVVFENGDFDQHTLNEIPVIESFSASDTPYLLPSQREELGIADALSTAPVVEVNVDLSASYESPFAGYVFNYPGDGTWEVGVAGTDSNALSLFSGGLFDLVFPMVTVTHNQSEQIQIFIPAVADAAGALTQVAGYFTMQSVLTTSLANSSTSYVRVNDRPLSITEGTSAAGDPVIMVTTILEDNRMATLLTTGAVDRDTLLGIAASIRAIEGVYTDTANISPYLEYGDEVVVDYAARWYFDATAGDIVSIDMTSEDFDTLVQLLDPAGDVVAQNDNRSETDTTSLIPGVMLPLSGTYTIIARDSRSEMDLAPGWYRLSLKQTDEVVEQTVPTREFNGQQWVVSFEGTTAVASEVCETLEAGTVHLWTFEATQGDEMWVNVYGAGLSGPLREDILELYASDGSLLGVSERGPIDFQVPATATYTALVRSASETTGGRYCVEIRQR